MALETGHRSLPFTETPAAFPPLRHGVQRVLLIMAALRLQAALSRRLAGSLFRNPGFSRAAPAATLPVPARLFSGTGR